MAPLLKPCDTPWRVHALCVVGLWALLPAGPALANELTLDVATRLERIENPDLDPNTDDDATRAILRFNLGLLTETPVATLRFGASVSARQRLDGDGVSDTLSDPRLFFDYTREVAEASFGLSGSVAETDLRVDQEIDDFDDTNGIRRTTQLGTRFSFGDGTPTGLSFSAENRWVTYRDDAGTQEDFTRTDLRSGLRLSPNRTTDITFGLSYGLFDGDRSAARETWGFDAGVALERPLGRSTVSLDVRQTEDQTRSNLSFGHSFETKRGTQGVRLGFARVDNGDLSMIGGLDLSYELPRGNLTGSLDRRLSVSDDDDSETLQTRARLGYVHALTPLDTLSFDVSYAQNREIGSGDEITNTEIGATWSRELSPDWSLDLGLRHRQRQQDTGPDGRSNSAFIELRRGLSLRF